MDFAKTRLNNESAEAAVATHKKYLSLEARHSKAIESARKIRLNLTPSIFIPKLPQKSTKKFPWISSTKPPKSLLQIPPAKSSERNTPTLKITKIKRNPKLQKTLQRVKVKLKCNPNRNKEANNKRKRKLRLSEDRRNVRKVSRNSIKTKIKTLQQNSVANKMSEETFVNDDAIEEALKSMGLEVSTADEPETITVWECTEDIYQSLSLELSKGFKSAHERHLKAIANETIETIVIEDEILDNINIKDSIETIVIEDCSTEQPNLTEDRETNAKDIIVIEDCPEDQIISETSALEEINTNELLNSSQTSITTLAEFPLPVFHSESTKNIYSYNESLHSVREFQDILKTCDHNFASTIDEEIYCDLRCLQDSINDFSLFLQNTYMDMDLYEEEQSQIYYNFAASRTKHQEAEIPSEFIVRIDVPEMPEQILTFRATDIMQCTLENYEQSIEMYQKREDAPRAQHNLGETPYSATHNPTEAIEQANTSSSATEDLSSQVPSLSKGSTKSPQDQAGDSLTCNEATTNTLHIALAVHQLQSPIQRIQTPTNSNVHLTQRSESCNLNVQSSSVLTDHPEVSPLTGNTAQPLVTYLEPSNTNEESTRSESNSNDQNLQVPNNSLSNLHPAFRNNGPRIGDVASKDQGLPVPAKQSQAPALTEITTNPPTFSELANAKENLQTTISTSNGQLLQAAVDQLQSPHHTESNSHLAFGSKTSTRCNVFLSAFQSQLSTHQEHNLGPQINTASNLNVTLGSETPPSAQNSTILNHHQDVPTNAQKLPVPVEHQQIPSRVVNKTHSSATLISEDFPLNPDKSPDQYFPAPALQSPNQTPPGYNNNLRPALRSEDHTIANFPTPSHQPQATNCIPPAHNAHPAYRSDSPLTTSNIQYSTVPVQSKFSNPTIQNDHRAFRTQIQQTTSNFQNAPIREHQSPVSSNTGLLTHQQHITATLPASPIAPYLPASAHQPQVRNHTGAYVHPEHERESLQATSGAQYSPAPAHHPSVHSEHGRESLQATSGAQYSPAPAHNPPVHSEHGRASLQATSGAQYAPAPAHNPPVHSEHGRASLQATPGAQYAPAPAHHPPVHSEHRREFLQATANTQTSPAHHHPQVPNQMGLHAHSQHRNATLEATPSAPYSPASAHHPSVHSKHGRESLQATSGAQYLPAPAHNPPVHSEHGRASLQATSGAQYAPAPAHHPPVHSEHGRASLQATPEAQYAPAPAHHPPVHSEHRREFLQATANTQTSPTPAHHQPQVPNQMGLHAHSQHRNTTLEATPSAPYLPASPPQPQVPIRTGLYVHPEHRRETLQAALNAQYSPAFAYQSQVPNQRLPTTPSASNVLAPPHETHAHPEHRRETPQATFNAHYSPVSPHQPQVPNCTAPNVYPAHRTTSLQSISNIHQVQIPNPSGQISQYTPPPLAHQPHISSQMGQTAQYLPTPAHQTQTPSYTGQISQKTHGSAAHSNFSNAQYSTLPAQQTPELNYRAPNAYSLHEGEALQPTPNHATHIHNNPQTQSNPSIQPVESITSARMSNHQPLQSEWNIYSTPKNQAPGAAPQHSSVPVLPQTASKCCKVPKLTTKEKTSASRKSAANKRKVENGKDLQQHLKSPTQSPQDTEKKLKNGDTKLRKGQSKKKKTVIQPSQASEQLSNSNTTNPLLTSNSSSTTSEPLSATPISGDSFFRKPSSVLATRPPPSYPIHAAHIRDHLSNSFVASNNTPHTSQSIERQQNTASRPAVIYQTRSSSSYPSHPSQMREQHSLNFHPDTFASNPLLTPPQSVDPLPSPCYRPAGYYANAGFDPTISVPMTPPSDDAVRQDGTNQNAASPTAAFGVYNSDGRPYSFKEAIYSPAGPPNYWGNHFPTSEGYQPGT